MNLFISLDTPHQWIIMGPKNQAEDSGKLASLDNFRAPKYVARVIGVAPGDSITCHSASIPGKRRKLVERALPYALEEKLTEDVELLHFKLMHWTAGGDAKALVVSKSEVDAWLSRFRQNGINLDSIIPDYFLLPMHPHSEITISPCKEGQFRVRTGPYQGLYLDEDDFDYWWSSVKNEISSASITDLEFAKKLTKEINSSDAAESKRLSQTISHWKIGNNFPHWLMSGGGPGELESFNILDGDYKPSHDKKSVNILKYAAATGCFAIVLHWGMLSYQVNKLENIKNRLDNEMQALFFEHFPDEPYLYRPKSQLSALISEAKERLSGTSEFQVLLTAVSEITPRFRAAVNEISYHDDSMTLVCVVRDMASLDTIEQAFNNTEGIHAELLSSAARDGKITGRLELRVNI